MAGTAIVILKLMTDSAEAPVEAIKLKAHEFMKKHGAMSTSIDIQEVAFGLKALVIKAAIPEDKGTDLFEEGLGKIPHVSSISIEDYRRAFG